MVQIEEWRQIARQYEVSDLGRVRRNDQGSSLVLTPFYVNGYPTELCT